MHFHIVVLVARLFPTPTGNENLERAKTWRQILKHFGISPEKTGEVIASAVNAYCSGNWGKHTPAHLQEILKREELRADNSVQNQRCLVHNVLMLLRALFDGDALAARIGELIVRELEKAAYPLLMDLCTEFNLTELREQVEAAIAAREKGEADEKKDPVEEWQKISTLR